MYHRRPAEGAIALVVSPSRACQMLDCGETHLYELLKTEIKSYKDGKSRKIVVVSIHEYIERKLREAAQRASLHESPANEEVHGHRRPLSPGAVAGSVIPAAARPAAPSVKGPSLLPTRRHEDGNPSRRGAAMASTGKSPAERRPDKPADDTASAK